jgi:hypothetical protein
MTLRPETSMVKALAGKSQVETKCDFDLARGSHEQNLLSQPADTTVPVAAFHATSLTSWSCNPNVVELTPVGDTAKALTALFKPPAYTVCSLEPKHDDRTAAGVVPSPSANVSVWAHRHVVALARYRRTVPSQEEQSKESDEGCNFENFKDVIPSLGGEESSHCCCVEEEEEEEEVSDAIVGVWDGALCSMAEVIFWKW